MKNGADYYQGYLFAKPLNETELAASRSKFVTTDPIFARVRRELTGEER
jgi:c-di-GMP-related signal transduction protein